MSTFALTLTQSETKESRLSDNTASLDTIVEKIFKKANGKCNHTNNEQTNITGTCIHLLRISHALKYFQLLVSSDEADAHNVFIEFCIGTYSSQCLEDYIHFICKHSHINEIAKIVSDLENNYGIVKCSNISKCNWTIRHIRHRNDNNCKQQYNLYIDIFDSIHFYLFHLEHVGLRVSINANNDEMKIKNLNCIDDQIKLISKEIHSKTQQFEQYFQPLDHNNNNNSKFIIQQTQKPNHTYHKIKQGQERTFINHMFEAIEQKYNDKNLLNSLTHFIVSEEYDTDCIVMDVDIFLDNIIYDADNDIKFISNVNYFIKQFVNHRNVLSNSFHTGVCFWYHSFYKNCNAEQQIKNEHAQAMYENDFQGVSVLNLYVPAHFNSIKEEALNSSIINIESFNDRVINKGNQYIKTKKCRKIKCKELYDELHYDIRYKSRIQKSHLYSLILYCDFTKFSTSFSATFRKIKWNESIEEIKLRNSKFANIARYLRELIQYYGIENETGPFYTGLSFCMNIGSFSIRLIGPTSTSIKKEIAMRFAGKNGLVLQLNCKLIQEKSERFFDSSWISCYPEESERIFFGGRFKVQLTSIIVIHTAKNYMKSINSLYKFDCMLSGERIVGHKHKRPDQMDVSIIEALITYLFSGSINNKLGLLDEYMMQNFYLFSRNKTQIIFNLSSISKVDNKQFADLILYSIENQFYNQIENNNNNLFNPIIFKLFPNLIEIIIYTSLHHDVYAFNILSLLSILKNSSLCESFDTITIKDPEDKWLYKVFGDEIKQSFAANKLHIELQRRKKQAVITI